MPFLKSLVTALLWSTIFAVNAQDMVKAPVVLELFTSQGCSSCPIADELLEELKDTYAQENVFVLSYHVDYWNRLGWKDPFSQKAFSDYQSRYATAFRSRNIYTPQLVVNGTTEFVGGNKQRALQAIKTEQRKGSSNSISLKILSKEEKEITVDFNVSGTDFDYLTIALVVAERVTKISRGENRNKTLKNANIVAARTRTQVAEGNLKITIPDWVTTKDELSLVAYTQSEVLTITGANHLKI